MRMTILAGALALAMTPGMADAALDKEDFNLNTTAQLMDVCDAPEKAQLAVQARNFCLGFIEGAIHYHDHVSASKDMGKIVCAPPGATREDVRVIFVNWAFANRSDKAVMESNALVGLISAAMDTWSCTPK